MKGRGLRIFAVIVLVLGILLSIKLSFDSYAGFDISILIVSLLFVVIFVFPCFAMGRILDELEKINQRVSLLHTENKPPYSSEVSQLSQHVQLEKSFESGKWVCSSCGTVNPKKAMSCKDCGTYR